MKRRTSRLNFTSVSNRVSTSLVGMQNISQFVTATIDMRDFSPSNENGKSATNPPANSRPTTCSVPSAEYATYFNAPLLIYPIYRATSPADMNLTYRTFFYAKITPEGMVDVVIICIEVLVH